METGSRLRSKRRWGRRPWRGHNNVAVDADLVHHPDRFVRAERLGPVRPRAGNDDEGRLAHLLGRPGPVGAVSFPEMHLRVR